MTVEDNKKLVEEIPWLAISRKWIDNGNKPDTYEIEEDYDYEFTVLDMIPVGWRRAFGLEMVREIDEELKRQGEDARNSYNVLEIKEKYGSLRWYCNGDQTIQDIIDKYAVISTHVCIFCGKPDVPIRIDGYLLPECEDCYETEEGTKEGYKDVVSEIDGNNIPDSYHVNRWTPNGYVNLVFDISQTAKNIREKWEALPDSEKKYLLIFD